MTIAPGSLAAFIVKANSADDDTYAGLAVDFALTIAKRLIELEGKNKELRPRAARADDAEARVAQLEARMSSPGDQKYLADDGNGNQEGHDTLEGARACANLAIAHWESMAKASDGEWCKCVMHVTVWAAIERALPEPGDDEGGVDFILRPIPVTEAE